VYIEMPVNPIINKIETLPDFYNLLQNNPGLIFIKFGAEWCRPCKKIAPLIDHAFSQMPATVQCCELDVDENFQVYGFLKTKKMVNGIPVVLCYYKGNINYIPDDIVVGSDINDANAFFTRCIKQLQPIQLQESSL